MLWQNLQTLRMKSCRMIRMNLLVLKKKAHEIMVHGRLYKILMTYFDNIVEKLKELKIGTKGSKIRNLYMTGSSLGGGLAILFAFEMIRRGYINEESMKVCKYNVI
eukprot:177194_1